MMYPELEGEIRRQEAEIARQVRDQVLESLYQKAFIAVQTEQEGMGERAGDTAGGSETVSSRPLPLYPKLGTRTEGEEGKDGSATPVADLENWPRGKDVLACNRHMLENQLACDVWFRVGREGEGAGEKVGAHAYVLRSRSSAFYAMLERRGKGELGEGEGVRGDIALPPDTSPKVLWQLLRYLYYEDLQLDADTVLELLELANTYDVVALKDACLQFLPGNLAVDTVCSILEKAHTYTDKQLTEACLRFIRKHGSEVIESSGLVKLCRECLNRVLTLDGLEMTPTQRQEAADRWASHRCQDPDLPEVDKHKHLGDVMYVKKDTAQSRCYFSGDGAKRVDKHKLQKHSLTISPFSAGSQLRQITRFRQIGRGSVTNTGSPDAVTFSVDYPIYLYGFGIYGPSSTDNEEASYRVDTALSRKNNDIVLESISIKGVGAILPVMLEKPVKLKEDKKYTLAVYVQGPPSQCGASGKVRVSDGQVIFTFFKPSRKVKGNRTDILTGQIPRLYYLPC